VVGDVVFRPSTPIELPGVPAEITQPPLQLGPARHHFGLIEQDLQRIRDRAVLDHERTVHIGFAQRQFGIEENTALGPLGEEPGQYRAAGPVTTGKAGPVRGRKRHRAAANELTQEITQQPIHRSTNGTSNCYTDTPWKGWFQ
jgi:hypothetical protein